MTTATREQTICAVCDEPAYFRWSDTHGVAVCDRCGMPYRLYHYENNERVKKAPSIAVKEAFLPLAREYWQTTQRRVFPAVYDMGFMRGEYSYSGATEDDCRAFDEWMQAQKARWPVEPATPSNAEAGADGEPETEGAHHD